MLPSFVQAVKCHLPIHYPQFHSGVKGKKLFFFLADAMTLNAIAVTMGYFLKTHIHWQHLLAKMLGILR
jgi:hypothetical protein